MLFQADAFNAFNRANWNNPAVNNVGAASFGQITGSLPGRVLQLGEQDSISEPESTRGPLSSLQESGLSSPAYVPA